MGVAEATFYCWKKFHACILDCRSMPELKRELQLI
jgi:hypothetical protein